MIKKVRGLLLKDILQTKSYFITNSLICLLFLALAIFEIVLMFDNSALPGSDAEQLDLLKSFINSSFFYFCIFPIYNSFSNIYY